MNTQNLLFAILPPAIAVTIGLAVVIPRRIRMERRARALLARHPDAERKSVYVAFPSGWPSAKRQQIDAQIAHMSTNGWTFLRAREASPLRTICSWGGGVNLHFIRIHDLQAKRGA